MRSDEMRAMTHASSLSIIGTLSKPTHVDALAYQGREAHVLTKWSCVTMGQYATCVESVEIDFTCLK